MAVLNASLFGALSVTFDGREITLPYKKAAALLFYLIVRRRATRSELVELLWEDADNATAMKNLRHAIYSIRKELGVDPFTESQRTVLEFNDTIEIRCDVVDFRVGNVEAYGGELLEGFSVPRTAAFDEWLSDERNMLQTQRLKQLLAAEQSAFYEGDLARAESIGLSCIDADPLEENAVFILMQVYSAQKKYRRAIALYHDLCKNLSEEFSISPLRETTELYYEIVDEWNASTSWLEEESGERLFGKEHVLRKLIELCNGSRAEHKKPCCLIQGAAGVGKSYLLDYVLRQYDFSDWLVCRARCYESESHRTLAPWNAVMMSLISEFDARHIRVPEAYIKSASGLFPCLSLEYDSGEIGASEDSMIGTDYHLAQESTLLIFSQIAKEVPILLVFEDIHWMDSASVEMLSAFLHRLCNLDVTVICTARSALPENVQQMVVSANRDQLMSCCSIYNFTWQEAVDFINYTLPMDYSEEILQQIYKNTGGNPVLLVQLLASLRDSKNFDTLPTDPESIVTARLEDISDEERRVLDAISVFPDWAPYDILSSILTIDPLELMSICTRLRKKVILIESTVDGVLGYSFAHRALRKTLNDRQSNCAMRILHLRVAQCLEVQADKENLSLYEQIISHYTVGGNDLKAFEYKVRSISAFAGRCYELLPILSTDAALPNHDEDGLMNYFQTLEEELQRLRASHFGTERQKLGELEPELLYAESRYCIHNGLYERGLPILERLLALRKERQDDALLARIYLQYIYYAIQTYNAKPFKTYVTLGLALSEKLGPCQETASFYRLKGLLCLTNGRYEEARDWFQRSIELFQRLDTEQNGKYAQRVAGAYNYIAETYRLEQDYETSFHYYDQAIVYNRSCGSYPGAAVFYTDYGVAAFQYGRMDEALNLFETAEEIYASSHEFSQRPIALAYLAYFDVQKKAYDDAYAHLTLAVRLSEKIRSPWWYGITIYMMWRIRLVLEQNRQRVPILESLWPADRCKHCEWAISYLAQLEPRLELREMEETLAALQREVKNAGAGEKK